LGALGAHEQATFFLQLLHGEIDRLAVLQARGFLSNGAEHDVASYADLMNARTQLPGQFLLSATYGTEQAAADHYWNTGYAQGRSVSFDPLKYLASNVDLLADLGADAATATAHYMASGRLENRPYDATLASRLGTAGADSVAGTAGNDGLFGLERCDCSVRRHPRLPYDAKDRRASLRQAGVCAARGSQQRRALQDRPRADRFARAAIEDAPPWTSTTAAAT
jgi:hypothetical protein